MMVGFALPDKAVSTHIKGSTSANRRQPRGPGIQLTVTQTTIETGDRDKWK